MIPNQVEFVAETHYGIKTMLVSTLKKQVISNSLFAQTKLLSSKDFHEYWVKSNGDKFFDMGTFIRLGSSIEVALKQYYMVKKGYPSLLELKNDKNIKPGIFQRIDDVAKLYKKELGYELSLNLYINLIKEIMLHRHLFAHNAGILDDKYMDALKALTGVDIVKEYKIPYPFREDVVYFKPLLRLDEFIEGTRAFFYEFPV